MGCPKSPWVSVCFSTQMVKLWMIGGSPILGNSLITGCPGLVMVIFGGISGAPRRKGDALVPLPRK